MLRNFSIMLLLMLILITCSEKKQNMFLREPMVGIIQNSEAPILVKTVSDAKVRIEYKKAGAIILPSINEGFGLTLVEGAASGCFPLATEDGGMVEIIEQIKGINFPHDPSGNEIRKALRKYLDSLPIDRKALAERAQIFSREQIIPREMLYIADEVFFTGSAAEVTPIRSVDKIPVGKGKPGPITLQFQKAFFEVVNGERPDKYGWLTHL